MSRVAAGATRTSAERLLQTVAVAEGRARWMRERLVPVAQFALVYLVAQAGIVCFLLVLTDPGSPWGLVGLAGAVACTWLFARLGA
jgi:hypothetical protein